MLKLGKIIREKKCKIIQKSTDNTKSTFIKWGGGACSDKNNGIGTEFKIYIDSKDYEMRNTQMYSKFS